MVPSLRSPSPGPPEDGGPGPARKRAGDGVDHVVSAGAVGHAYDPDFAGGARVAVRRKAHPWLVRQGQHLESMFAAQREEQLKREVAWNAKNVGDADLRR